MNDGADAGKLAPPAPGAAAPDAETVPPPAPEPALSPPQPAIEGRACSAPAADGPVRGPPVVPVQGALPGARSAPHTELPDRDAVGGSGGAVAPTTPPGAPVAAAA